MLSEILFVLLVLVVAALMMVDLMRTRSESAHGHADRPAHGAERAVTVPARGSGARMFSPEPASVMPRAPAPAPAAGLPARETGATHSFDQMRREMSQSAASEAALRGKFTAMYLNLSRRSQALVERQLRLIDSLEHGEQDQQRLASLSKLNRIAMRIHRTSQNLLVLAGQEPSTSWNQPVTLAHLVEAALDEIEDYERVAFEVQPDVAVRGPAVYDAVHLLVELIDNATSFSAAEMPVHITGRILTSGGALVDITDRGIGMSAKEIAYANQQLDDPPAPDIDVPKWMGLLVVARLAARHGIRVRLNPAEFGGLTALVWFPDEILTHYSVAAGPGYASDPGYAAGRGYASDTGYAADPGYPSGPGYAAEQRGAAVGSAAFAAARMNPPDGAVAQPDPAWSGRGPQATVQAEPAAAVRFSGSGRHDAPGGDGGVVVPQAESLAGTQGLPIFHEVESRWSGGGRDASGPVGLAAAGGPPVSGPPVSGPPVSGLPRRPSAATQGPRGVPSTPNRPGAAGFQRGASPGWPVPGDEANPGGPDES